MTTATVSALSSLPPWLSDTHDVLQAIERLEQLWVEVDRKVPAKSSGTSRLIYELADVLFEGNGQLPVAAGHPEELRRLYQDLESRWLAHPQQRSRHIDAIRYQVLQLERDSEPGAQVVPREARFSVRALGYIHEVPLRVVFPPASLAAHQGEARVYRAISERLLATIPVAEITGYQAADHSIEVLGQLHRFAVPGRGHVICGDSFTANGCGRELAAAMLAGLVVRHGESAASGPNDSSPAYALTPAGQEWVIQHPHLTKLFERTEGTLGRTAYLQGSHGTVPFDTQTGAVLGTYGDPTCAPLYIDVDRCAVPIESGETYDVLMLAYHAVGGRYEKPEQDCVDEVRHAGQPGM